MIRRYCDKCGKKLLSSKDYSDVNLCVCGIYTVDLCQQCAETFDKMAVAFVNDHTEPHDTNKSLTKEVI